MRVARVTGQPLDAPLVDPFRIASTRLDRVRNVAVRAVLDDGTEGWGEIPTLPPVTREDQPTALAAVDGLDPHGVPATQPRAGQRPDQALETLPASDRGGQS